MEARAPHSVNPAGLYPYVAQPVGSPFSRQAPAPHYPMLSPSHSPITHSSTSYSSPDSSSSGVPSAGLSPLVSGQVANGWHEAAAHPSMGHLSPHQVPVHTRTPPRLEMPPSVSGMKRTHSSMSDFIDDVQRKRMTPVYHSDMVDRLDLLASTMDPPYELDSSFDSHLHDTDRAQMHTSEFNPTRAPRLSLGNSLADINLWLVQLGNSILRHKPEHGDEPDLNDYATDPAACDFTHSLNQYGLANIPGVEFLGTGNGVPTYPVAHSMTQPHEPVSHATVHDQMQSLQHAHAPYVPESMHMHDAYALRMYESPALPQVVADRGIQHNFRRVELLTRAPPEAADAERMEVDGDGDGKASTREFLARRQRHLDVVIKMLLALNKGRPELPEKAPSGHTELRYHRMYPSLSLPARSTDRIPRPGRPWMTARRPSTEQATAETLPAPAAMRTESVDQASNTSETKREHLPSIAELLSHDMS